MDNSDILGPVEPLIPQLRETFDDLWNKGYFSFLNYLPYYGVIKEIIFRELIIKLKSNQRYFNFERGESIKYFSNILERDLILVRETFFKKGLTAFPQWQKEAQRQYNLNQLV